MFVRADQMAFREAQIASRQAAPNFVAREEHPAQILMEAQAAPEAAG
jgi:hypothetical protein